MEEATQAELQLKSPAEDNSRCGRLFPEAGPSESPPPSWLPANLTPEVKDATYRYLEAVQDVKYSLEAWNRAVAAGTVLLRTCGGWRHAVAALRRGWRDKGGDHFAGLFVIRDLTTICRAIF